MLAINDERCILTAALLQIAFCSFESSHKVQKCNLSVTQESVLAKVATQAAVRICSSLPVTRGWSKAVAVEGLGTLLELVRASHSLTAPARVPQFMADGHLYSTESPELSPYPHLSVTICGCRSLSACNCPSPILV